MDDLFSIAFYTFLAVAVCEAFLSGFWQPWYYRSGLVAFSRRVPAFHAQHGLPAPAELAAFMKSGWLPSLLFRELSPGELAFREKVLELHLFTYTPLMHGLVEARPLEQAILVQGRLNWSALIFPVVFLVGPPREAWGFVLPFMAGLYALLYAIQAYRYRQVVAYLSVPPRVAA